MLLPSARRCVSALVGAPSKRPAGPGVAVCWRAHHRGGTFFSTAAAPPPAGANASPAPPAAPAAAEDDEAVPYIFEVDDDSFLKKVLQPGHKAPILVQCTADWCGPCKTLGPILKKVVKQYNGALHLAIMDVDKAPQIAAQMQVKQIPMVVCFKHGKQPDGREGMVVAGMLPTGDEETMTRWIEMELGLKPAAAEADTPEVMMDQGTGALAGGDATVAMEKYNQALNLATNSEPPDLKLQASATAGLLQCYMLLEDSNPAAKQAAVAVASALQTEPLSRHAGSDVSQTLAAYALRKELSGLGDPAELEAKAAGGDLAAKLALAKYAFSTGELDAAMKHALDVLKADAAFSDEELGSGKTTLITFFEALGDKHPSTVKFRRRMANYIFC